MRTVLRNKKWLYYSRQGEKVPQYRRDLDGNIIYITVNGERIPAETGDMVFSYEDPVKILANIYVTGGQVEYQEYGHDFETFGAMIVCLKGEFPIDENTLIWDETEPVFKQDGTVDIDSADYRVKRATSNINEARYILERITKTP